MTGSRELRSSLLKDLRRRHVIPFVGAGVSRSVQQRVDTGTTHAFPSWSELLEIACKRLDENKRTPHAKIVSGLLALNPPAYLDAAKYAQEGLGTQWLPFLKEQLDQKLETIVPESLALPRLLWEINNLMITTNYDHVLKWACPLDDVPHEWNIQNAKGFVELLKGELTAPTVWHLHGNISEVGDLILTQDGYDHLYTSENTKFKYRAALATLRNLLVARTFLFVGFSLDDENFGSQLKWLCETFENSAGPHYVLLRPADFRLAQNRLSKLNVEVIEFDDFGQPLLDTLQFLIRERDKSLSFVHREPRRIRHNLPRPTTSVLVGRDNDKVVIREALEKGGIVLIDGNAGVGKTTLALEVARNFAREPTAAGTNTFDSIVWISAKTTVFSASGIEHREQSITNLKSVLSTVAGVLERQDILQHPDNELVTKAYEALAQHRVLLVLDNFESLEDESILTFIRQAPVTTTTLLTSRAFVDTEHRLYLSDLSEKDSKELIRNQFTGRQLSYSQQLVSELYNFAGGNPLALEWAIAQTSLGNSISDLSSDSAQSGLVAFLFGRQLNSLRNNVSAVNLLVCLALFPCGADMKDLFEVAEVSDGEHHLDFIHKLSLIERKGEHIFLLPVTKRLLLPELEFAEVDIAKAQLSVSQAMLRFLQREENVIWLAGSHRSNWLQQKENVLWAIEFANTKSDEDLELSLMAGAYAPMLMHGELSTYAGFVENGLVQDRWKNGCGIARLAVRAASVYCHLDKPEKARVFLGRARDECSKLQTLDDELQNMLNFVECVIAVETNDENADEAIARALEFEKKRGLIWTQVGFAGWHSILRCNQGRWSEAENIARPALAAAKNNGLFRSITFVSVPLARAVRSQERLEEAKNICDEALSLADEFAETHNFAHLCFERGQISGLLGEVEQANSFYERAIELYSGLGITSRASHVREAVSKLNQ